MPERRRLPIRAVRRKRPAAAGPTEAAARMASEPVPSVPPAATPPAATPVPSLPLEAPDAADLSEVSDWIAVGQISGVYGTQGEVRVRPLGRDPQRFRSVTRLFVGEQHLPTPVSRRRVGPDGVVLRLETVRSRDAARALIGTYLYVPEQEAVTLPPGEYFVHQLIGLAVRTATGRVLGTLEDVLETGSNDVYVVRGQGREVLLPAIKEVVKRIDLDNGEMEVTPLPGLLDEEAPSSS